MKFKKEFLQNFEGKTISDEICDHSRWSVTYYRIFMHDGKYYGTSYSRGATEIQDERPYEYDDDIIELEELFPYQKYITVYLPASQIPDREVREP